MHKLRFRCITDTIVESRILHRDYETRSRASLKACGAPRYAADPSTTVLWLFHTHPPISQRIEAARQFGAVPAIER